MKKLIATLLVMMFILTVFVACGNDEPKGNSDSDTPSKTESSVGANTSSVASLSSEEKELWGDVSIGVGSEDTGNGSQQNSSDRTESTSSTVSSDNASSAQSETANTSSSAVSSEDKDQGYLDWVDLP